VKYKVGDKVRVRIDLVPYEVYGSLTFFDGNMSKCAGQICTITEVVSGEKYYVSENPFVWSEEMLKPADSKTLRMADGTIIGEFNTGGFCTGFKGGKMPTPSKPVSIEEQLGLPKIEFKNGSYIKAIPNDNIVRGKTIKDAMDSLIDTWSKIGCTSFWMSADEVDKAIKRLEEKNLKFTFYTEEGYRIDKSNNSKVETITTFVKINGFDNTYLGMATCDKVDYSEREGVINALANAMCNGNFDREFNKAVKANELADKKKRTCTYCGKVFDTVEEREAEEAWHVERKKARRERYLLRKRAKEIAFEEQAQKMAKEMIEK